MLRTPAEYPHPGSFALVVDPQLPLTEQHAELVRLQRRDGDAVAISFPLRAGVGYRVVDLSELIDGTPLTPKEHDELRAIERALVGRDRDDLTRAEQRRAKRGEALRQRMMAALILASERARLDAFHARDTRRAGGSIGQPASDIAA
jgi:hypothetical protein